MLQRGVITSMNINVIMSTVIIAITITNVVMLTTIITIMVTFKNIYIYIYIYIYLHNELNKPSCYYCHQCYSTQNQTQY